MSHRPHSKSRIKVCNKPVFHLQDKKAVDSELPIGLIKSAKRTGQLSLCNKGLGADVSPLPSDDDLLLNRINTIMEPHIEGLYTVDDGDSKLTTQFQEIIPETDCIQPIESVFMERNELIPKTEAEEDVMCTENTQETYTFTEDSDPLPENVWKIDELVMDDTKEVDFAKSETNNWWNMEPLKTLDLSSNSIRVISPNVKLLQQLITLKLHDNAITSLPREIGELKSLSNLSLSHNKLKVLPIEFYMLTDLRWLSLAHNEIDKIEPDFGDLVMLNFLDISYNKIQVLPPGMGYLVRLVELNLSYNELQELPPDIVNLRDLKKFNICNNNLKKLPPLGELRKMEIFDANNNDIEVMPDFYGCAALKEIYLANNCIKEITEEFCDQMQHLYVLNIRDNKLEVLPENIALLKTLKRLDLTNNNLNKLPRNLGLLSQLQSINMEGNKLSFVRQDVVRGGTERMMKYLRERITEDVVNETIYTKDDWPDKYTLKKSQALMVPARELTGVPDHVFAAAAEAEVHIVDFSKNKLTAVPPGILRVSDTLSQLLLSSNSLTSVPPEINRCRHLQFMDLGKNCLTDLPLELGDLKNLRELVISNNKFTKIPRCVYELDNLEILLAAENKIEEINVSSDAFARLRKLAVLDLANNSIHTVPPELGHFTHLRALELMGNCFRQPRHAVLAKGTASVLSYLRDRIPTK